MRSKVTKKKSDVQSQNLQLILKLIKSKKFRPLDYKRGHGKISFSLEIEANPARPKDWLLHTLVVPDLKSHEHEHYSFNEKEMREIRDYIDRIILEIQRVKRSKRK